jgi:uncharacterized phage protein (TIGR02218 family)
MAVSAVTHTRNGDMPSCQIVGVCTSGAFFDNIDVQNGVFDGAKVQIYIVDRNSLSRKGLLFTGVVSNTSLDVLAHLVSMDVKGSAAFSRILMTRKRSPMCQTDLFSTLCGVNSASYAVSATVASIVDRFNFTVSGLAQASGYFNQGVCKIASSVAFQMANWVQSTQTITTYLPSNHLLVVGSALTLYPGCDKTLAATGCGKFSNWLNFQGEPHFLGTAAASQQV